MKFIPIISIVILIFAGVLGFMISWKLSKYAISRQDKYRSTAYKLFLKKISWALFWSLLLILIVAKILQAIKIWIE
jgi:hypothetical protein